MTAPMTMEYEPSFSAIVRDEASFRLWYDAALPRVHRYLVARCGGDDALAEELTQQTFVEAIRQRDRFDGRSDVVTWLIAIGRNKLVDHHRRHGRDERRQGQLITDHQLRADAPWQASETRVAVAAAMAQLPCRSAPGAPVPTPRRAGGARGGRRHRSLREGDRVHPRPCP